MLKLEVLIDEQNCAIRWRLLRVPFNEPIEEEWNNAPFNKEALDKLLEHLNSPAR